MPQPIPDRWWQVFIDPAYIARSRLRAAIARLAGRLALNGGGIWLDIGCGAKPYEPYFAVERWFGIDVALSGHPAGDRRHDLVFDGDRLPVRSASVDGVLCTQVLEHTARPDALLAEIYRVLKPGSPLLLTAPFLWEEHEKPYDFFRYTEFGLRQLLVENGFELGEYRKTAGTLETIGQVCAIYALNNLRLPVRGFGRIVTALVSAPLQIAGLALQKICPDEGNLYLDHAVLAYKRGGA